MTFSVAAQPPHQPGMQMGGSVLFLGRATGDQVVPRTRSTAAATAAIIIDQAQGQLRYDITFIGLERGPPTRIGLYNFGAGGNGRPVVQLCGGGDLPACPHGVSARLSGATEALRWSGQLLSEFASGRIYLQIDGGDGRAEIRGQLEANGAMVPNRNYVARLAPRAELGATGEGTAVYSETYLPGGEVMVEYSVTVAGTSGRPEEVALIGVADPQVARSAPFLGAGRLPGPRRPPVAPGRNGGTFNGAYTVRRGDRSALLAERLLLARQAPALAVRTSRFPRGELVGVFVPIE
jgi:hypothetical protein